MERIWLPNIFAHIMMTFIPACSIAAKKQHDETWGPCPNIKKFGDVCFCDGSCRRDR